MKMAQDPEKRVPEADRDEREEDLDEGEQEVVITSPDRPTCPRCGWHNTRLSHTKTVVDKVLRVFSVRAFRCRTCGNRLRSLRRSPKS